MIPSVQHLKNNPMPSMSLVARSIENPSPGADTFSNEFEEGARRRVKVLLVGCGRMGQVRARHIYASPRFLLLGIVDVDISKAKCLADHYTTNAFATISEAIDFYRLLDDSSTETDTSCIDTDRPPCLDAIIISTPTPTHEILIKEASRFASSILTEKPVGETAEKIAHLFDHCRALGVALCCSFQRRFDRAYVATQQAIARGGRLGKPLQAHIVFGDHPSPPIQFLLHGGGNIYMDLLPHDVDYLRWCFDDEISTIYATGVSSTQELHLANIHDRATVVATFQRGAVATFTLSRFTAYGYDQRCEIWGGGGLKISVQNEYDHPSVVADDRGIHFSPYLPSFPQRFDLAFATELDTFADTILHGKPWPVTEKDCIAVQRVCDAAKKSSDSNIPVHLENLKIYKSRL